MAILLKNILEDINQNKAALKVQIYLDMDGVLVDLDGGFKKISGGYGANDFKNAPQFNGNEMAAKRGFWKLIQQIPGFWDNLDPMPDAVVLWNFVRENFKIPAPVVLSAGQGEKILAGKTAWIRKHIDPNIKVIIAAGGVRKPEYILNPNDLTTTHVLVDDTPKNIDAWDDATKHRIAIIHTSAANSIKQLQKFL